MSNADPSISLSVSNEHFLHMHHSLSLYLTRHLYTLIQATHIHLVPVVYARHERPQRPALYKADSRSRGRDRLIELVVVVVDVLRIYPNERRSSRQQA